MSSEPPKTHADPGSPASAWVCRWAACLPRGARVLDFACGGGRNAAPLLAAGARVVGADADADALARLPGGVERVHADLESAAWPFAPAAFDAIVCCNYLFRPRLDLLFGLVAPGGLVIYETFARGNERYGRPSNPKFLLVPGELVRTAERNGFTVLAYEHAHVAQPRPARVQRLAAARPPVDAERFAPVG